MTARRRINLIAAPAASAGLGLMVAGRPNLGVALIVLAICLLVLAIERSALPETKKRIGR